MTDIIDKAAMALSAGLMLLGIVGMGILEVLVGAPYGPVRFRLRTRRAT